MKTKKMSAILGNISKSHELFPLTEIRPLDTIPFNCKYRLIDFPLSSIVNANINSIFMIFNEGEAQSVFDHIGGGKEWGLDSLRTHYFFYTYQDFLNKQKEGKLYYESVIDYLEKSESEYNVFIGSNMLCNIDLRAVLKIHQTQQNDLTVVYKKSSREFGSSEDGHIVLDDNGNATEIVPLSEVDSSVERVNLCMDIYITRTDWLIEELKKGQESDATANIFEFIKSKLGVVKTSAYDYTGYLSNIHDIASFYQANMDMLDPAKFNALLYSQQKIYTKFKNEVPTYYADKSVVKNSQCATGCIIEGTLENSLVSRLTTVKKGAEVKNSIIMPNADIGENALIEYAILDKNVVVKENVKIIGTAQNPIVIRKNQVVSEDVQGGVS